MVRGSAKKSALYYATDADTFSSCNPSLLLIIIYTHVMIKLINRMYQSARNWGDTGARIANSVYEHVNSNSTEYSHTYNHMHH